MFVSKTCQITALEVSKKIADWLCNIQAASVGEYYPPVGYFPFTIYPDGTEKPPAQNWNYAFASMALLTAYRTFGDDRYERAALNMARYMKSLQILDPFHGDNYGAIREVTPFTPWCFTRDALSVAWAFVELYRHTKDDEYLERAKLWGEWFLKNGFDEEGWPTWGHEFEPLFKAVKPLPHMRNDVQGSFHGGSLNFLYQLAKESGENKWIGSHFTRMADHFVKYIQLPSGFYAAVLRDTKQQPDKDPQWGLHRANDDLGTLGLLCAYKVTGNKEYLKSINKFVNAVFKDQWEDGRFEESVACIPVVLNVLLEGKKLLDIPSATDLAIERALNALFEAQSDGRFNPRMFGGILENGSPNKVEPQPGGKGFVCARSSCYSLIVLPKLASSKWDFLTV
ncbi:MAG: AGE family epimerase/isomerase [Fibrobacteres bacterium]|nr:AGE family epimerase/isomerase [Fibrobacterota bacterium]